MKSRNSMFAKYTVVWIVVGVTAVLLVGSFVISGITESASQNQQQDQQTSSSQTVQDTPQRQSTASASSSASATAATPTPAPVTSATKAQTSVQAAIDASGLDCGMCYIDLTSGQGFNIDGSDRRVAASMIKLVILDELLHQVAAGTYSLDQPITVKQSQVVGGTGIVQNMSMPATLTLSDLATYMISHSDNTAANIIIDMVGMDAVNARAASEGLTASSLNRRMMDTAAISAGVENYMSAADAAKLLQMIYKNTFVNASMSDFALSALKAQSISQGVIAGVPAGIVVAHKTGTLTNVENDAAIVYATSPYVLVVMTDGGSSSQDLALIENVSEAVYDNRG